MEKVSFIDCIADIIGNLGECCKAARAGCPALLSYGEGDEQGFGLLFFPEADRAALEKFMSERHQVAPEITYEDIVPLTGKN